MRTSSLYDPSQRSSVDSRLGKAAGGLRRVEALVKEWEPECCGQGRSSWSLCFLSGGRQAVAWNLGGTRAQTTGRPDLSLCLGVPGWRV